MYSRPWVIVTGSPSLAFAFLGFPVFARARGPVLGAAYTLAGLAVIWATYFVRAWVCSRPGFQQAARRRAGPE